MDKPFVCRQMTTDVHLTPQCTPCLLSPFLPCPAAPYPIPPSGGPARLQEDSEGNVGVSLSKELMSVAGEALKVNITTLGPLVLPFSEQVRGSIRSVLLNGRGPFAQRMGS
jgi:hypothetical protein